MNVILVIIIWLLSSLCISHDVMVGRVDTHQGSSFWGYWGVDVNLRLDGNGWEVALDEEGLWGVDFVLVFFIGEEEALEVLEALEYYFYFYRKLDQYIPLGGPHVSYPAIYSKSEKMGQKCHVIHHVFGPNAHLRSTPPPS
jgi:hypothetical protein